MTISTATISGTLVLPDDTALSTIDRIEFTLTSFETEDATILPEIISAEVDENGDFSIDIWPNETGVRGTQYQVFVIVSVNSGQYERRISLGNISVPAATTYELDDLLGASGEALVGTGVDAVASALLARRWASEDEDVEVADGEYSAKNYALKASASAAAAAAAVIAAVIGNDTFKTVAALIDDDNEQIGYSGSGANYVVAPGYELRAGGFRYQVIASAATDQHVETAGGVKLKVLPSPSVSIRAIDLSGDVAPEIIEGLWGVAASANTLLCFDADITVDGDVEPPGPAYVFQPAGVTYTCLNTGTFDNGQTSVGDPRHLTGAIMGRAAASGSVLDFNGTIDMISRNAGDVGGATVQAAGVALFGCHNVRLRGTPTIKNGFNGVCVVDCDDFHMLDRWSGLDLHNATVDLEGCYDFTVIAHGERNEEVVDCQSGCQRGYIDVTGSANTQASLEINNSWDISYRCDVRNAIGTHVFDYPASAGDATYPFSRRWSQRGTEFQSNRNPSGYTKATYDTDVDLTSAFIPVRIEHCEGGRADVEIHILSGITPANANMNRAVKIDQSPDVTNMTVNVVIRGETDILSSGAPGLCELEAVGALTFTYDIVYPLATDIPAVYMSGGDSNTRVFCNKMVSAGGQGYNLHIKGASTDTVITGAHFSENTQGHVLNEKTGGNIAFLPYAKDDTRPTNPRDEYLANGQQWLASDGRMYTAIGAIDAWDWASEARVAAGSTVADAVQLKPGLNRVNGADGTKGAKLYDSSIPFPCIVRNNHASNDLIIYAESPDDINGSASVVLGPGDKLTFDPDGANNKWV